MYQVALSAQARRVFEDANKVPQRKLDRCFDVLSRTPRSHPNIKALKGKLKGLYRYRAGDYRVIYRIHDDQLLVFVMKIVQRGGAY